MNECSSLFFRAINIYTQSCAANCHRYMSLSRAASKIRWLRTAKKCTPAAIGNSRHAYAKKRAINPIDTGQYRRNTDNKRRSTLAMMTLKSHETLCSLWTPVDTSIFLPIRSSSRLSTLGVDSGDLPLYFAERHGIRLI